MLGVVLFGMRERMRCVLHVSVSGQFVWPSLGRGRCSRYANDFGSEEASPQYRFNDRRYLTQVPKISVLLLTHVSRQRLRFQEVGLAISLCLC